MRRPYVFYGGNLSGWPIGTVPTPQLMMRLDQFSSELVNGEEGGSWAPSSPIVLGPYAESTLLLNSAGSVLSGDIETVKGNTSQEQMFQSGLILLSGAAPPFQTARTREVKLDLSYFAESNNASLNSSANEQQWFFDPATGGLKHRQWAASNVICTFPLPMRAHHSGATITKVEVRYRVGIDRPALPTTLPKMRLIRADTAVPVHMASSTVSPYDTDGWLHDVSATPTDYYANGQTKLFSYIPAAHTLDPYDHMYALQFAHDDATDTIDRIDWSKGNQILSAVVFLSNIVDMRPE